MITETEALHRKYRDLTEETHPIKKLNRRTPEDLARRDAERAKRVTAALDAEKAKKARPVVQLKKEAHEDFDATLAALAANPAIYQRGERLVTVIAEAEDSDKAAPHRRKKGSPRIWDLDASGTLIAMSRAIRFEKTVRIKDGEEFRFSTEQVKAPKDLAEQLARAHHLPGVRHLDAISEVPVLRPDGTICSVPGYDQATRVLFKPSGFVPPIPENPSQDDAKRAAEELLELVQDFPFPSNRDRAGWLAACLTPLARSAFAGPVPLFLVSASTRGSGKGMLVSLIAHVATGRDVSRHTWPRAEGEFAKMVTAILLSGEPICLLDNLNGQIGGPEIESLLTAESWGGRLLGGNSAAHSIRVPARALWFANGNNIGIRGDMDRRALLISLQSDLEHPERRGDFRIPRLIEHVQEHRGRLVCAALTVLRAFFAAGRPSQNLPPLGSFEGWSDLVRQAVVFAGQPDPLQSPDALVGADEERETASVFVHALQATTKAKNAGREAHAATILEWARAGLGGHSDCKELTAAVLALCPSLRDELPNPKQLGNKMRVLRNRNLGGRVLRGLPDRKGVLLWRVQEVAGG